MDQTDIVWTAVDNPDLTTVLWSEAEFAQSCSVWTDLLRRSSADSLFMSWYWLNHWWQLRKPAGGELCILACYLDEQLVGIAPLYREPASYLRGSLRFHRLQLLGSHFGGGSGIRCEYGSLLVDRRYETEVVAELLREMRKLPRWDELYLSDIATGRSSNEIFFQELKSLTHYHREEQWGHCYRLQTAGSFETYLQGLGRHTRLKLYNRRKLLESMGKVQLLPMTQSNFSGFFEQLNRWHVKRWGHATISEKNQQFLKVICGDKNAPSFRHSSMLLLDDQPMSVIINLSIEQCIYNIQSGFVEKFDKRIALGSLHLGYVIEQAFTDPNVQAFDLLEGRGKQSNYKSHVAKSGEALQSTRWFRSRRLSVLFWVYDRLFRH